MSIKAKGKVFRDPVHGLIRIMPEDAFIYDLINTSAVQRLRSIRQLGVSRYTYPGAEHSRFVHSLGVYWMASRIISVIEKRHVDDTKEELSKYRKAVLAAALLHDIGHGPFSHAFERALKGSSDHEAQTIRLINDPDLDVYKVLIKHEIAPATVASVINKTLPVRWLVDVVSSQLDADRMEYLLRDSLCTGVKYGLYDCEWLINCMRLGSDPLVKDEGTELPQKDKRRLCLDKKRGLYSVEQLILARKHMHDQVYFHETTRGWEAHLICLLNTAQTVSLENNLPRQTPLIVKKFLSKNGKITHSEWINFTEVLMEYAFSIWGDTKKGAPIVLYLRDLAKAFLARKKLFKCCDLSHIYKSNKKLFLSLPFKLKEAGLTERQDYLIDEMSQSFYKHGASAKNTVSWANSILVSDEDSISSVAQIAEDESPSLKALTENGSIVRLYYHVSKENVVLATMKV